MSRFSFIILFLWCLSGLQTNPIIKTSQQLCQTLVLSYKGKIFNNTSFSLPPSLNPFLLRRYLYSTPEAEI